jgi:hypothetical protein
MRRESQSLSARRRAGKLTSISNSAPTGNSLRLAQMALQIVRQFRVSRRTAYRHLQNHTLPASNRRIGCDGKSRPAGNGGRYIGDVEKNLLLSVQALRRADRFACEQGVSADDLKALEIIKTEAVEILERWRQA